VPQRVFRSWATCGGGKLAAEIVLRRIERQGAGGVLAGCREALLLEQLLDRVATRFTLREEEQPRPPAVAEVRPVIPSEERLVAVQLGPRRGGLLCIVVSRAARFCGGRLVGIELADLLLGPGERYSSRRTLCAERNGWRRIRHVALTTLGRKRSLLFSDVRGATLSQTRGMEVPPKLRKAVYRSSRCFEKLARSGHPL
jgi:hypothetical protein